MHAIRKNNHALGLPGFGPEGLTVTFFSSLTGGASVGGALIFLFLGGPPPSAIVHSQEIERRKRYQIKESFSCS